MDSDYAAVHNEHAWRARRSSVCRRGAALDGNIITFHAADRAGRNLLGPNRREARNETSEQQEKQRQAATGARVRGHYRANELELGEHRPPSRSPILYSSE